MTWSEIKKAVEAAGVKEDEEICLIQCDGKTGSRVISKTRLARSVRFTETLSGKAKKESSGCAA